MPYVNSSKYANNRNLVDSMSSFFQHNVEEPIAQTRLNENKTFDNNIVTFNQMENNAERQSFRRFCDSVEDEKKLEEIANECSEDSQNGVCKYMNTSSNITREQLERLKDAEIAELKTREKLCRDTPQLVDLKNKLQQAYINKEISLQLAEREAEKLEQKLVDEYYKEQEASIVEKFVMEDRQNEELMMKRKVEYRKALEQQMEAELKLKEQEKFNRYREDQKMADAELERIKKEDQQKLEEKVEKMVKLREAMLDALKIKEELKKIEYLKKEQEQKKLENYWEQSSLHEKELKILIEQKKQLITQRQEECAKQLAELNDRKAEKTKLVEDIVVMSKMLEADQTDYKQELDEVNRRYKQDQFNTDLNKQCVENVSAKTASKKIDDNFKETWIWGDSNRNSQLEKQKLLNKETAEYNRQRMVDLEQQKKLAKCAEYENGQDENKSLIEQERKRILKLQDPSVFNYLPNGTLKSEDLNKLSEDACNVIQRN